MAILKRFAKETSLQLEGIVKKKGNFNLIIRLFEVSSFVGNPVFDYK